MTFTKPLQVLDAISATSKRKEKLTILTENKDVPLLKDILMFAYNPRLNFYQESISVPTDAPVDFGGRDLSTGDLDWLRSSLCSRSLSGAAAVEALVGLYLNLNLDGKELLTRIVSRDVRAGIGPSTINSVWPKLIPETPYMRCSLPSKVDPKEWFKESLFVYSQEKMDAMFAYVVVGPTTFEMYSRSGNPISGHAFEPLKDIQSILAESMDAGAIITLTTELCVYRGADILPREESNGLINSIIQGGFLPDGCRVVCVAWDIMDGSVMERQTGEIISIPYAERFARLRDILLFDFPVSPECPYSIVEHRTVSDWEGVVEHYKEIRAKGGEGLVLKHPKGWWRDGDSKDQVKIKQNVDVDLVVVGFVEGQGKNANTFGSILCESSCGELSVAVSGFKDADRIRIHKERDSTISRIICVRGNTVMPPSPSNPQHSIFLPRFVEFREDKTTADDLKTIISSFEKVEI